MLIQLAPKAFRAVAELARARLMLARFQAADITHRNLQAARIGRTPAEISASDARELDWVAFVIPRIGARLPWRADCLVQAIAAQNWLQSKGISAAIAIGVEKPADGRFGAHAWLRHGDRIITGGDISRYQTIHDGTVGKPET